MEYVVAWVAFSVLVGVWARSKGRSMALAFVASLLLSPLGGLVIVAVWKPREQIHQEAARAGRGGDYKVCPQCAETIRVEAVKCRYCGSDLADSAASSDAVEEARTRALIDALKRRSS